MKSAIPVSDFLSTSSDGIVLDVRSPAEFEKGHIPNAISFPIFNNKERAELGTLYKNEGKQVAILRGLEIVGPKLKDFVLQANTLRVDSPVYLYCWRGGMRSGSMQILLSTAGIPCQTLVGGYKSYRNFILKALSFPYKFKVIGGKTGSGKSEVLRAMHNLGAQIIDLEALANHKGSAFGKLGENPQPSTEHFANCLYHAIKDLDANRTIWIEDESQTIGQIFIPPVFYLNYRKSPLFVLEIPFETRVDHLVKIYGNSEIDQVKEAFNRIGKKLGGQHLKQAIIHIENGEKREAAAIALKYYDKTYSYGLEHKHTTEIRNISFEDFNANHIANRLLETENGI